MMLKRTATLALGWLWCGALLCGTGEVAAEGGSTPELTTEAIQKALDAAVDKAQEIRVPMGISIVDIHGNLVGFIKMDGTFAHTNHTSFSKAYTSASVRRPTHEMKIPAAITDEIASVTGGKFTVLPGGFPLVIRGSVVGGIGVGGGNAKEDMVVAKAGAEALQKTGLSNED